MGYGAEKVIGGKKKTRRYAAAEKKKRKDNAQRVSRRPRTFWGSGGGARRNRERVGRGKVPVTMRGRWLAPAPSWNEARRWRGNASQKLH